MTERRLVHEGVPFSFATRTNWLYVSTKNHPNIYTHFNKVIHVYALCLCENIPENPQSIQSRIFLLLLDNLRFSAEHVISGIYI